MKNGIRPRTYSHEFVELKKLRKGATEGAAAHAVKTLGPSGVYKQATSAGAIRR